MHAGTLLTAKVLGTKQSQMCLSQSTAMLATREGLTSASLFPCRLQTLCTLWALAGMSTSPP